MIGAVYTDDKIGEFISKGIITSETKIEQDAQIQPSSLDVRCGFGKKVWHLPFSSIPQGDLITFLDANATHTFNLDEKRFLHKNNVYVLELEESLTLPEGISAKANPKSTTGRLDVHTRLLTDKGQYFDKIEEGYCGKLFIEVVSNSFDLYVTPGFSFNQLRFFKSPRKLDQGNLEYLARVENLLTLMTKEDIAKLERLGPETFIHDGAVCLTLKLDEDDPGYMAREDAPPVDLSLGKKSHPFSRYFLNVNLNNKNLVLIPNSFYLLKTSEVISIPLDHCAEMVDIATELGEFRAHYAGFFDPGFKSIGVVEVRNTGRTPTLFRDGMNLTSLEFYALIGKSSKVYGSQIGSNYQGQAKVTPAKFFDMEK